MTPEDTCEQCPIGVDCTQKGETLATLLVEPTYFRAANESTEVYPCTFGKAACPGNLTGHITRKGITATLREKSYRKGLTGDGLCAVGYEGPLCDRLVSER